MGAYFVVGRCNIGRWHKAHYLSPELVAGIVDRIWSSEEKAVLTDANAWVLHDLLEAE